MNKKTIKDIEVSGKKVLVRCDFNVPLNKETGEITNDLRIVSALPTIKYLLENNAKVILCSHLGKPKGEVKPNLSLKPVAERLTKYLGFEVKLATDIIGESAKSLAENVKEGEAVPKDVADVLTKLEIHPMEVGIDLLAVYEDNTIYTADVLEIDEEETKTNIATAYQNAINLSVFAGIVNSQSAPILIQQAARDAMNLAINANILTSETTDAILSKAYAHAMAIASKLSDDALDEDLKGKLSSQPVAAAPVEDNTEEVVEEEEVAEEEEEEDAAAGLAMFF